MRWGEKEISGKSKEKGKLSKRDVVGKQAKSDDHMWSLRYVEDKRIWCMYKSESVVTDLKTRDDHML